MALINAAMAALLAVPAAMAARLLRRPSWIHGLWLLVLLKLLTPPLLGVAILPPSPEVRVPVGIAGTLPPVTGTAPGSAAVERFAIQGPLPVGGRTRVGPLHVAGAVWLTGGLAILALTLMRGLRFRRLLRDACSAGPEVRNAAARVARRVGVRRAPEVLLVPGPLSPMLWWRAGRPRLLFPHALLSRLSADERDTLLAHEMAHLRRGDHWVRLLEVAATAGFWWHPAVWLARIGLRRAEEQSCDAWVVRALPGSARAYAEALLKTLTFLSTDPPRLPALASGIGGTRDYEERLTMILQRTKNPLLARRYRLALLAAALLVLLAFPTRAERPAPEPPASPEAAAAPEAPTPPEVATPEEMPTPPEAPMAPEPEVVPPVPAEDGVAEAETPRREDQRRLEKTMRDLERQARELEGALREVRRRQAELSREARSAGVAGKLDRLRAEADRLDASGEHREAELIRGEMEMLRQQIERERLALDLERQFELQAREREAEYRRMKEEMAAMSREERAEREQEFQAQRLAMEAERRQADAEAADLERELERDHLAMEAQQLREEAERLRQEGDVRSAEQRERELEGMRLKEEELQRRDAARLEAMAEELRGMVEKLEAAGAYDEADEIRERLEALQRRLDDGTW
jgi:beta-lactamase regulating signal transducer with metallopeptidase domain